VCNCTPQIRTPFCGKGDCVAPNMQTAPEYKIIGQRSAFYCIEKNGMPMSAEAVLAELQNGGITK
jgi:hypothetical protein